MTDAFVEFPTEEIAKSALDSLSRKIQIVKNRHINIRMSSQSELIHAM
jgi:hypothetical protein